MCPPARIPLTVALIAVSGCATAPPQISSTQPNSKSIAAQVDMANADFGPSPKDYEALIRQWAAASLKDPESARYGRISRPRKEWMVENLKPYYGYSVCADINAKNSYGGYTGAQTFWFMFRDGRIVRSQNTVGLIGGVASAKMISIDHPINCQDGPPEAQ